MTAWVAHRQASVEFLRMGFKLLSWLHGLEIRLQAPTIRAKNTKLKQESTWHTHDMLIRNIRAFGKVNLISAAR